MLCIGSLMPQQVAVGASLAQRRITRPASLAKRERHRTIGMRRLNSTHDVAHHGVAIVGIFPTLQHKGAEAQRMTHRTAVEYLLTREPITCRVLIATTYAAVVAVILTDIANLYKPAHIYLVPIFRNRNLLCGGTQLGKQFVIFRLQNIIEHMKRMSRRSGSQDPVSVSLSALSIEGTVMLPLHKTDQDRRRSRIVAENRNTTKSF